MWEVDPETKSKLLAIQKTNGNDRCCDCGAPSPQWASPKFSTFICLTCAGTHRGLGVHISFVRSITMDAFKPPEIRRMELGGNNPWKQFWEAHADGAKAGKSWNDTSIEERYSGEAGEEWKERLSAKVDGRGYVPVPKVAPRRQAPGEMRSGTPMGRASPARTASPASSLGGGGGGGRKAQNESFFARLGNENATRPADVPPSQGGKYAGFGSEPPVPTAQGEKAPPGVDEFQKDPVAALTKGFSWFTTTVGKGAKSVNEGWIQPTAQKLAEADLATTARLTAAQVAQTVQTTVQTGTKGAAEQFNRFVEGENSSSTVRAANLEPDKRDFWDTFGTSARPPAAAGKSGAIGTAAMRKGGSGAAKDEGWDEDKWEKF